LFISTPRGHSYFYTLFLQGLDKLNPEWESFRYSTYDNPYIKVSEIDAAKASLPESAFQQEYLAIPNANSNSVVGLNYLKLTLLQRYQVNLLLFTELTLQNTVTSPLLPG
jgi:hypothetical protein